MLPVQVIGQQWEFTYRYPTYGGVETADLVLPAGRQVAFHVTSIDAVHSFWAYELGVKADANPGVDNVAYVKPSQIGTFQIRCAELCGLWHGYMFDTGRVVSVSAFKTWIATQQKQFAGVEKYLPKYSTSYAPDPTVPRRMNLRRLIGFNLLSAVVLGVVGFYLGWWLGHQITGPSIDYFSDTNQNDVALFVAYLVGVIGFLVGLGFANYPVQRMLGKPPTLREKEQQGAGALLRPLHRPQGRRHPVPDRHRRLHLHRRTERDVDPLRADAARAPGLERQQLPHPGRGARHDDDGDDDERDPRARSRTTSSR